MASTTRYKDLLDYTISYKMVWTIIAVVFALCVAGAIAYFELKPPTAEEKARQDVRGAERLLERAKGCAQTDLAGPDQKLLVDGSASVEKAQSSMGAKDYVGAATLARTAQDSLKQFVDSVCAARDTVANFVRIQGEVKVKKAQSQRWVPARKGPLSVGDRIQTGDGVSTIVWTMSNEVQTIGPGSIIEIKDVFRTAEGTGSSIKLETGTMRLESTPNSISSIATNHATVRPKGDVVDVESPQDGSSTRVRSGRGGAEVESNGRRVTMARSTRIDAGAGGLSAAMATLESPEPKLPLDGRVFSSTKPEDKVITFEWLAVGGAVGYDFQISFNDLFQPVLNAGDQRVKEAAILVDAPSPNTYFWRVASVDSGNVPGAWSEIRRFSIQGGTTAAGKGPPPPKLSIDKPVEFGDRVIIKGKTEQYVTLEIFLNGRKYDGVSVDEHGEFQVLVTLSQEGKNVIDVVAHDTYGQEVRKQAVAYFSPL